MLLTLGTLRVKKHLCSQPPFFILQSNCINMDTDGATESVHINWVSVSSKLNLEKM